MGPRILISDRFPSSAHAASSGDYALRLSALNEFGNLINNLSMRIGTHCGGKIEDRMVVTVFRDLKLLPDRLSFLPFLLRFIYSQSSWSNQIQSRHRDKNAVMENHLTTI